MFLKVSRVSIIVALLVLTIAQAVASAADSPPKPGQVAKDFELASVDGSRVKLSDVTSKGPVVLIVLRGFPGYQCPICNQQVGEFLKQSDAIKSTGATVLLIYPGPSGNLAERAKEFIKDKTIPDHFKLLIDADYKLTNAYHLRWNAPKETAYPSTFVIQKDGTISFAKVSSSHKGRSEPEEILKALKDKR